MPVIKSALKKMHQDKKRTLLNKNRKAKVKKLLDKARKNPSKENITVVISAIDKLAKVKVIHKNKAARLKSRLNKLSRKEKVAAKDNKSNKRKK